MSLVVPVSIRPYALGDAPEHYEAVMESRNELRPWLPWCHDAYSLEDSRGWIEMQVAAFSQNTEYAFVITDAGGKIVGGCGLNHLDWANQRANLGYWVRSSWSRRGAASSATRLLADWAFANTKLRRLEIVVATENIASQRTAEKAGALREGILRNRILLYGRSHDAVGYSLVRLQ